MAKDKHNVSEALAALGGKKGKTGTGPIESQVETSGDAIEDLGDLVETNEGVPQEVIALARDAAKAADESREAGTKAKVLKAELDEAMKLAEVTEVQLEDRKIAYVTKNEKAKTLKALKTKMMEAAVEALTEGADEKDVTAAKAKASAAAKTVWDEFWARFPTLPGTSLDIPKPTPEPEPEPEL